MKKEITLILCDQCSKEITGHMDIQIPHGDLDSHGIWFGDVKEWLWFHDENFCSLECLIKFISDWHSKTAQRL